MKTWINKCISGTIKIADILAPSLRTYDPIYIVFVIIEAYKGSIKAIS